jgi:hypothetical protein
MKHYPMKKYGGKELHHPRPRPLYPCGKSPGTHWVGGKVGPRASLDAVEKIKISGPCREFNPGRPGIHWIGDKMGPRVSLDAVEKIKISGPRREPTPGRPVRIPSLSDLHSVKLNNNYELCNEKYIKSHFVNIFEE